MYVFIYKFGRLCDIIPLYLLYIKKLKVGRNIILDRNFFKNLKINKKILLVLLGFLILIQLVYLIVSYFSIKNIGEDSNKEMIKLSVQTECIGESSLKDQSEEYLKGLSFLAAKSSNSLFNEISNQVLSTCNVLENIYKEKNISKSELPLLPELNENVNKNERNFASSKAYAIDSSSLSIFPLVYNISEYFSENIIKLSPEEWNILNEEEKKELSENKCVVSKNNIPEEIYKEMLILNNIKYIL